MSNRKRLLALLLALAMVFALAACGGDNTAADPTPTAAPSDGAEPSGEPVDDGPFQLDVCVASEPQSIDPAKNSALDGAMMLNHMFEGLMKWEDSGNPSTDDMTAAQITYGQAESYDRVENADGTATYTFHLRDGIQWSDGKPVTAGDFEYAWRRLVDPETAADYSYMIDCVVNANDIIAGAKAPEELAVKAVDDKTFEVTVNDVPYFTELCAFPATFPVRQDMIESAGDTWTYDVATYIGNGPYKMSAWNHNSAITIVPSETYYAPTGGPDSIVFHLMDDNNAILSGYNNGELAFIENAPVDEVPGLIASGAMGIADYVGTYYVCFQTQRAPFDDPRVREAFTLAVDRRYIVEQVSQSGEVEAGGFVPAGISDAEGATGDDFRTVGGDYFDPYGDAYEANCKRAKELLAEAGYPDGEGFPVVEYLYNTDDKHKSIGEALQNMWQEVLGVTVQLNNQEWAVFLQTRKAGDYSIARNGWMADYNDPMSFLDMWVTDGGNNDAQYANAEYDSLIQAAKASTDPSQRMKLMHQAEDLIIGQDHALCPLYFYTQTYMLKDNVKGVYYTPLGYFFFGNATRG